MTGLGRSVLVNGAVDAPMHAWYGEDRYRPSALLRRIAVAGGSLT